MMIAGNKGPPTDDKKPNITFVIIIPIKEEETRYDNFGIVLSLISFGVQTDGRKVQSSEEKSSKIRYYHLEHFNWLRIILIRSDKEEHFSHMIILLKIRLSKSLWSAFVVI